MTAKKFSLTIMIVAANLLLSLSVSAQTTTIRLKGQIDIKERSVAMQYVGASSMLGNSGDIVLNIDANGRFDTILPLAAPAYYNIIRNTLYLSPGDDMEIYINEHSGQARFSGRGAEANRYLSGRFLPKGGSFLNSGDNVKRTFSATKTTVDSLAQWRLRELETVQGVSDDFRDLERARIQADIANSYLSFLSYCGYKYDITMEEMGAMEEMFTKDMPPLLKPIAAITDVKYLDLEVLRNVFYLSKQRGFSDLFTGLSLPQRSEELLAAYAMKRELDDKPAPETIDRIALFVTTMKQPDFKAEMERALASAGKLSEGAPAPDFSITRNDGKEMMLSELKGRVLYIDLWATWCAPCLKEAPAFEALAEKYAGNDNILFVKISTDTNEKAWKNFIATKGKGHTQYISKDKRLGSEWVLAGIPRFILIDKDFKILDAFAPRPSDENIGKILDAVLK